MSHALEIAVIAAFFGLLGRNSLPSVPPGQISLSNPPQNKKPLKGGFVLGL